MTEGSRTTILGAILLLPSLAFAQAGVAPVPDETALLVNKDVDSQRWTISLNVVEAVPIGAPSVEPEEPAASSFSILHATGNVFSGPDVSPSFLFCELRDDSPGNSLADDGKDLRFDCDAAPPCADDPAKCARDDWHLVAEDVRLPLDFFLPPGGFAADPTGASNPSALAGPLSRATLSSFSDAEGRPAQADNGHGVTVRVNGEEQRYLLNSDVNAERWSISLNRAPVESAEGLTVPGPITVTGNVYRPDGSPPKFFFCDILPDSTGRIDKSDSEFHFSCQIADACTTSARECTETAWTVSNDDIRLPASFFLPRGVDVQPVESSPELFIESRAAEPPSIGSTDYRIVDADDLGEAAGNSCTSGAACVVPRIGSCEDVPGRLRRREPLPCTCVVDEVPPGCITCANPPTTGQCGRECSYPVATQGAVARGFCLPYASDVSECICYAVAGEGKPPVQACAGKLGTTCPETRCCSDDPRDGCDPASGNRRCTGICVDAGGCDPAREQCGSCQAPRCGDGRRDPAEECDGADFGGATCSKVAPGTTGTITCSDACTIDVNDCVGCGNGRAEGNEECDGADLGDQTCGTFCRGDGDLSCDRNCKLVFDGCAFATCDDFLPDCETGVVTDPDREFDLCLCQPVPLCLPGERCDPDEGICVESDP